MNYTTRTSRTKKRGFTLTEIAIVLGIVGLILGAIWVAAAAVYSNLRNAHADTEALQMVQAVRALYATNTIIGAGAAADQTAALITAGAIPKDIVNAAGTAAINQWPNGATAIWSNAAGDGFELILTAVPQSACINLITTIAGTNADPGLYNATAVTTASPVAADAVVSGPRIAAITPTAAATLCAAALNKVSFGFTLKS